uniref:Putative alpha-B-crystallin n=1 Tax=Latrodectus hesperus TaxID=256737 RepID=E7D1I1_LATHE|nr:putative alpha-B-crystallin [Latrodectus hesperus]
MSLREIIPAFLGRDWWSTWDYPERIMDQYFGTQLFDEDLLQPTLYRGYLVYPRTRANIAASGKSEVKNDDKEFQVALNVKQFKPEEIEVKIVDNYIVIHGKHEEKSEDTGLVQREFTRRYMLPKNCEPEKVTSSLNTQEGILNIVAPKKAIEAPPKQERDVPVKVDDTKSDK